MRKTSWAVVVLFILAASAGTAAGRSSIEPSAPAAEPSRIGPPAWTAPPDATWQYQLESSDDSLASTGGIDVDICKVPDTGGACVTPTVFDIDLYVDPNVAGNNDTKNTGAVDAIHANGGYAICYVSAGDAERWRPDWHRYKRFDKKIGGKLLGNPFSKVFPNEFWVNINNAHGQRDFVLGRIDARTKKCAKVGFDGIEYDVVDAYAQGEHVTGWDISFHTQLRFDRALAHIAHDHGLAVGLKNDLGQLEKLEPRFDFAINEQCFQYNECTNNPPPGYGSFTDAGKPVFQVEYVIPLSDFCDDARDLGFNSIKKAHNYSLNATPYGVCG
jgi:endo-alpha-1,4-polygalactosaminidase (GH114 family)